MATRRLDRTVTKAETQNLVDRLARDTVVEVENIGSITDTVSVTDVASSPSSPSYALQLAQLEEIRAMRRQMAANSPGFEIIPEGPSFWAQ